MTQPSIKEQLDFLKDLQKVDFEMHKLSLRKLEQPAIIKELGDKFEGKKSRLKQLEEEYKALLLKRKEKEGELAVKEESVKKLSSQLFQIKTNKEYLAMQKEISGHKADNSLIEDAIINLFDELDKKDKEIKAERINLQAEESRFNSERNACDLLLKEIASQSAVLDSQRKQILPKIDAKILSHYERILSGKGGLAVVPIQNDSCGGCYMNLPPQVIDETKKYEQLVHCGACARILYAD